MKILITGGYGYLGSYLGKYLSNSNHQVFLQGRGPDSMIQCSLFDTKELKKVINKIQPNFIINLAALTNVDLCEEYKKQAFKVNCDIPKILVDCLDQKKTKLIQISTDQVYNNNKLNKESEVNPINYYGETKLIAENLINSSQPIILRTNFIGKSLSIQKKSFSDWLINEFKQNKQISLFDDVYFNPLHIKTLSQIIENIFITKNTGIFNIGSTGYLSKADLSLSIATKLGFLTSKTKLISVNQSNLFARRPNFMMMDCKKFEQTFKIPLPSIDNTINLTVDDYKSKIN